MTSLKDTPNTSLWPGGSTLGATPKTTPYDLATLGTVSKDSAFPPGSGAGASNAPALAVLKYAQAAPFIVGPERYQVIICDDPAHVGLPSTTKVLQYRSFSTLDATFSTGIDIVTARNNGWVQLSTTGQELWINGYPNNRFAKFGLNAYLDAWALAVGNGAIAQGYDGVFIDNVLGDYHTAISESGYTPALYTSTAAWRADMAYGMHRVSVALRARGLLVASNTNNFVAGDPNSNVSTNDKSFFAQIAPDNDYLNREYYLQEYFDGGQLISSDTSEGYMGQWISWLELIDTCNAAGTHFIACSDAGLASSPSRMRFLRGSFLMKWDGVHGYTNYNSNYVSHSDPWDDNWTFDDIGLPSADMVAVGQGYSRAFSAGLVLMNARRTGNQSFTLPAGATYVDSTGTTRSGTVTVPPLDGMILKLVTGGGGGGGGGPTTYFSDDFSLTSVDPAKWDESGYGGYTVVSGGGVLTLNTPAVNSGAYLTTDATFDFSAKEFSIKMTINNPTSGHDAGIWLKLDANNYLYFAVAGGATPALIASHAVAGVSTTDLSIAYVAATHQYLRIRGSGGQVYFDTSVDGTTWTNRAQIAAPFSLTALKAQLYSQTYSPFAGATSAVFDTARVIG